MISKIDKVLPITLWVGLALAMIFLVYCFHFNVDISDESFYLYFFEWGHREVSFNFYHLFISPLGALFDHHLLFYRYLSLITITLAAYLMGTVIKGSKILPLIMGLLYFNLISTFSYNTLILVSASLVLTLNLMMEHSRFQKTLSLFIGITCFFAFSSRFGMGVILLGSSVVLTYLRTKNIKLILIQLASFAVPLSLVIIFWSDGLLLMLQTIKAMTASLHQGLAASYLKTIWHFSLRAVLPVFLIHKLGRKFTGHLLIVYIGWIILKNLLIAYEYPTFIYYFAGFIVGTTLAKLNKENFIQLLFPMFLFFCSSVGTNNNLIKHASYNVLLLFPCVYYLFLKDFSPLKRNLCELGALTLLIFGIYQKQYEKSYGSLPRSKQTYVISQNKYLSGIKINQELESRLQWLSQKLKTENFDKEQDKIFAYPDAPGYVALMGARAYGTPWYLAKYKNIDETNCWHFTKETQGTGQVFVLLDKPLTERLKSCLDKSLLNRRIKILNYTAGL